MVNVSLQEKIDDQRVKGDNPFKDVQNNLATYSASIRVQIFKRTVSFEELMLFLAKENELTQAAGIIVTKKYRFV